VNPDEIDVGEVLQELDPLGKALFDAALGRVRLRKAQARIEQLEQQTGDGRGDSPT
jgi:hypothetical protein